MRVDDVNLLVMGVERCIYVLCFVGSMFVLVMEMTDQAVFLGNRNISLRA